MYGCLLCAPYWGPGLQPKHVPSLGIKPNDPLVYILALNPLSYSSQGLEINLISQLKLHSDSYV